jgi:hypothetical protein
VGAIDTRSRNDQEKSMKIRTSVRSGRDATSIVIVGDTFKDPR